MIEFLMRAELILIISLLFVISCEKRTDKTTLKGDALSLQYRQQGIGGFNYLNKKDAYKDTVDAYVSRINYINEDSLELELAKLLLRDQQYRDSIHTVDKSNKTFHKKMKQADFINKKILRHIFENIGWPDTRRMNEKANQATWLSIYHNNTDIEFQKFTLPHIKKAFKDSIISPLYYAYLIDKIYVTIDRKQIYGTYPNFGHYRSDGFPYRISKSIDSINIERKAIGLDKLEL